MKRRDIKNRRPQRGYVLVLVAMLLWVILGFAALVIDVGLARAKLRRMQSATDTAALAGLRDELHGPGTRFTPRWLAAQTFHPEIDLDIDSYATQQEILQFASDQPIAGGTFEDPRRKRWIPDLAVNESNQQQGDLQLVAPNAAPNDQPKFLSRLRHSTEEYQEGIRHDSPPLPYLLGRATVRTPRRGNQAIAQGLSIKSVSVASTTTALTMGPPVSSPEGLAIDGVRYVATLVEWNTGSITNEIIAEGELARYTIGELVPSFQTAMVPPLTGYVLIYDPTSSLPDRIIGFGYIEDGSPVPGHVAETNAASSLYAPLDDTASLSLADYSTLFSLSDASFVQTTCLLPTPLEELSPN